MAWPIRGPRWARRYRVGPLRVACVLAVLAGAFVTTG